MTRTHDPVNIVTIGGGLTAALLAAKVLPGTGLRMVSLEQGTAADSFRREGMQGDGLGMHGRVNIEPGHVSAAADVLIEGEVVEAVVIEDAVDQLVREAVELLAAAAEPDRAAAADSEQAERARDAVLERFARADVTAELPTLVAGIGNLYEHGYDAAAEHMVMAYWGLNHQLAPALTTATHPA